MLHELSLQNTKYQTHARTCFEASNGMLNKPILELVW